MLISRSNPVGIDKIISSFQSKLYDALTAKWNGVYTSTPRCYRNQDADGEYVAEMFDGKDYREVYFDDTIAALSFFGIGAQSQVALDSTEQTNVHLVFFVNLNKILDSDITTRRDEEAVLGVQGIIDTLGRMDGFILTGVSRDVANCLKEYPGSRQSEGLKFRDQHPNFCFRFDMTVYYSPTLIDCF
jgi:hypothetical protein